MLRAIRRRLLSERDSGFSLVELIVAMLVLAIVILAIIGVQASALVTNADSNARQQATSYANAAMEQLRATPWNVLKKGMASSFVAASGGDPFVEANELKVQGTEVALVVASGSNDQELGTPWPPLYDSSGSHTQVEVDPAGRDTPYTVRSYVTEDQAGQADAYGLAVVVTWDSIDDGEQQITTLFSTAYAPSGGCGDLNNAPFLASCQALYYASSSSGSVVFSASATSVPATETDPAEPMPLFASSSFHQIQVGTASASARVSSQQVSTSTALGQFGGVRWDDDSTATQPEDSGWTEGFQSFSLEASDDDVTADAAPPNPADVALSAPPSNHSISGGSVGMSLEGRADDSRGGSLDASSTSPCLVGVGVASVPASQPCASARLTSGASYSGYLELEVGPETVRLGRVAHEGGASSETSWAARFVNLIGGNSDTGCQVLSGSGCTSAGVNRSIGPVSVGEIVGGAWADGDAASGLVLITGYSDSVRAERGTSQPNSAPTVARSGTLQYWDGSGYSTISLAPSANDDRSIGEVTWSHGGSTISASGRVSVSQQAVTTEGSDPLCAAEACSVSASNGSVKVTIDYTVEPASGTPFILSVATTLNGSTASASYKEPEGA